jgi:hypothetical protein
VSRDVIKRGSEIERNAVSRLGMSLVLRVSALILVDVRYD